jgi:acetyl/propionyl-CoA carboxylase alpha subunit
LEARRPAAGAENIMKYTAIVQGQNVEIELHRKPHGVIEAEIGGRRYTLQGKAVEPGVYWLTLDNQSLEIGVGQTVDGYLVSLLGRQIPVEILDTRNALRRAAQAGHDGIAQIRAPMPGKVIKLLVVEGAEVEPNQGIVVLEAMKMQNEIKSPKKGVVRKLGVTEGAAVNSGDLLATVE